VLVPGFIARIGLQGTGFNTLSLVALTGEGKCWGGIILITAPPEKTVVGMGTPPMGAAAYTQLPSVDGLSTVFSETKNGPVGVPVISFYSFRFPQS
tara:strand:+ start:198 stop:485 length:288 start_codon:yes stop_codon:yes gene_type:complete